MAPSARFWNWTARRYAKSPVADDASYQKKLEITRGYLRPDMELLEFGCGTASTAIVHAPHVKHIRATDISSKMLEIARGKAANAGIGNISFEQSSIEALEMADESVDMVLGLSILHLLEDRDAIIARVHRALQPGGLFVSSTVCLGDTMKFFKWIGPIGRFLGVLPLVRVFTVAELVASMTAAGFEILHQWQPARGKALFLIARKRT
ncbi:MAG: class I SAM-dependent methyltransferase [Gaiellaceae bacterium]